MTQSFAVACPVSVEAAAFIIARYLHENADKVHTQDRDSFMAGCHTMTDADYSNGAVRLNCLFDLCVGLSRLEELARNAWEESSDDNSYEEYKEQVAFHFAGEHRQGDLLNESYRGSCHNPPVEDNSPVGMFVRNLRSILDIAGTTTAETKKAKTKKATTKKAKTRTTKPKAKPKAKPKTTK